MNGQELKQARREHGLTQARLAKALGCSQPYLSLVESGQRTLSPALAAKAVRRLGLPATRLPFRSRLPGKRDMNDWARRRLGELGYPGFEYLARSRRPTANPADVLLQVLSSERCDPRLVEALPWLLLTFTDLDRDLLVREAWLNNVQNRLGFVVALAVEAVRSVGERTERVCRLESLAAALEPFRLAREDDLGQRYKTLRFRNHLLENRAPVAAHWNMLTSLAPERLRYVD